MDNLLKAASSANKSSNSVKLLMECGGTVVKDFATVQEAATFLDKQSEAWDMLQENECKLYFEGSQSKVTLNKAKDGGGYYQLQRYSDDILKMSLRYGLDISKQYFKYFESLPFRSLLFKAVRDAMDKKSVEYLYEGYSVTMREFCRMFQSAGYDTNDLEAEMLSSMCCDNHNDDIEEAICRLYDNIVGNLSSDYHSYGYGVAVSYVVNGDSVDISVFDKAYPNTSFSVKLYKKK